MSSYKARYSSSSWGGEPDRIFDLHFGRGLKDAEFFDFPTRIRTSSSSSSSFSSPLIGHMRECKEDERIFKVVLDVQQFHPRDLNVKTHEGFIVVQGKHGEKEDEHGFISREFTRRYALPSDVRAETIQCDFSRDGVLLISAPRIPPEDRNTAREVPIFTTL